MAVPIAVSPSVKTPGLYLTIDLTAGAGSGSTNVLNAIIMSPKDPSGTITEDTEVVTGGGEVSAGIAFGIGSPGHLAAKLLYAANPSAQVDFIAPAVGTGTATLNITFAGAPTSTNVVQVDIAGRTFDVAWLVGESVDDIRDNVIAAISERTNDLPVSAATNGAGIVAINGKVAGLISNDITVIVTLQEGTTGTETVVGALTSTPLAGGATDPDYTNALATIVNTAYFYITPCLSNVDAADTTGNLQAIVDQIELNDSGLNAKLQQVIVGYTGATANAITSAIARNAAIGELVNAVNGAGLPCELAGRETGGRMQAEALDPAANRIGEILTGYNGSRDVTADRPTLPESETALSNGVSLVGYNISDQPIIIRPITMHSKDTAGGSDTRILDVQNVTATYVVASDMRASLPLEFPNAKITPDITEGSDPPPKGVIEERDIKTFLIGILRFWQREGVITQQSVDDSIADGSLIVEVNASDATQVDIVTPFKIVPPLAKFGLVVQRVPN